MNIAQKITLLNKTTLDSLSETDKLRIIGKFTQTGLKILGGDFGFAYWKQEINEPYSLVYKSPNMTYEPRLPRKKGHAYRAEKTRKPYMGLVKKERITKYDMSAFMKSIVIIPIFYNDDRYGSLVLCFKNKRLFSNEERSLSTAVGNATAQAITINNLYSNLKKANDELEHRVKQRTQQLQNANLELEQDRAEDQALLASIGEGIIATDKEGKIILINPQAEEILGTKKEQLLGKDVFQVPIVNEDGEKISKTQRPVFLALQQQNVRVKSPENLYILRKNSDLIPVSITATPVFFKNEIIGAIQVIRDISKEKEMDRVKSELISLVSHQLRTPLSAINWYTEVLIKNEIGTVNKDQKSYLKEIYNANQKMIELVYDFLNVSRLELGTFTTRLSNLNLIAITKNVLESLNPLIKQKHLKIIEHYEGQGLEYLEADKKVLRLTLENLITNSIKYTPTRGKIEITINLEKKKSNKNFLSIIVTDNGCGIPKKQQSKVFSKLFRADNAVKMDTHGSGLGLYLVKSFVDFSKGKIWFKSKENTGSSFYVSLPVTSSNIEE